VTAAVFCAGYLLGAITISIFASRRPRGLDLPTDKPRRGAL
jgi:hypothetical protein